MNYWAKYILNIVLLGTIFTGVFTAGEYVYFRIMPMSHWVEYKVVKPIKTQFSYDESLVFNSIYKVNKEANIYYTDTLRCNIEDQFGFFSQATAQGIGIAAQKELKDVDWTFQAEKPLPPRTCYLDTVIEVHLPYGIKKHQRIIGDNFEIK